MGKKQHQSDKLYLTTTEWKNLYGGHKDDTHAKLLRAKFKRLPFTHCAISLLPFEDPIATPEGVIFDLTHIIPFLGKHGVNPVNGEKISAKQLIPLKFHKNKEGEFHCPITFKVFTDNSHIVFIKTTGNVFAFEAIDELNIKPKYWKDLITDEPFLRKDIVDIQNPSDINKFNIANFHHIKLNLKSDEDTASTSNIRKMNTATREVLKQLEKDYTAPSKAETSTAKADSISAAHFSTGEVAAGFTSTVMPTITTHEAAVTDEATLKYRRVKKKGYVRLMTTEGSLNLEIFADVVPKASENFIVHCKNGYYNDTNFHRLIKNFMIQGGDPTGTGKGGESIWEGKAFADEFVYGLSHSGRGVLAMANSGSDTNQSQFFITFRSCKHLDRKHTIFGRVVGGLDVLTKLEMTPVDGKTSKPLTTLKIDSATVFVDPFEEAEEQLRKERATLAHSDKAKARQEAIDNDTTKLADAPVKPPTFKAGVGKYIGPKAPSRSALQLSAPSTSEVSSLDPPMEPPKKKKSKLVPKGRFGDFSGW